MRSDKKQAIELRKQGKSYKDINKQLNIPISTLSNWLSDKQWSKNVKNSLINKAKDKSRARMRELNKVRGHKLKKAYNQAKKEARKEFEYFKFHPLFISGLIIYWGEGDRVSKGLVRVSNTDPLMIRLFVKFLTDICGAKKNKIKASLIIYPDIKNNQCKNFWVKNTQFSKSNFNKNILIKGRHKTKKVGHGICNAGIPSTYLKEKIKIWLKLLPNELVSDKYYNIDEAGMV